MTGDRANSVVTGTVEKIIAPAPHDNTEMVEIHVEGSNQPSRIRIENKLQDDLGNELKLKEGARVSITIAAESEDTIPPPIAEA